MHTTMLTYFAYLNRNEGNWFDVFTGVKDNPLLSSSSDEAMPAITHASTERQRGTSLARPAWHNLLSSKKHQRLEYY